MQRRFVFVSVADRRLRPKSRLQKAKTPARWLAFLSSGTILPEKYCTLEFSFCQEKNRKNRGCCTRLALAVKSVAPGLSFGIDILTSRFSLPFATRLETRYGGITRRAPYIQPTDGGGRKEKNH